MHIARLARGRFVDTGQRGSGTDRKRIVDRYDQLASGGVHLRRINSAARNEHFVRQETLRRSLAIRPAHLRQPNGRHRRADATSACGQASRNRSRQSGRKHQSRIPQIKRDRTIRKRGQSSLDRRESLPGRMVGPVGNIVAQNRKRRGGSPRCRTARGSRPRPPAQASCGARASFAARRG